MKKVTICACSSRDFINKEAVGGLAKRLEENGWEVTLVADLCRLFEQNDAQLKALEGSTIVACQERAVEAMLSWRNVKAARVLNLRTNSADAILKELGVEGVIAPQKNAEIAAMPKEEGTDAWFPVIDRSRCINCRKCHDFCLFGTYALDDEGKVQVVNPSHCKNNCPSCARMCPAQAIIFPKHPYSPINGGLEQEETVSTEMKDFYNQKLRERLQARREGAKLLRD